METDRVALDLPPDRQDLRRQLQRAASSITLNIAEGAGEFSAADKARFYRIARRSAAECAAALDLIERLELTERDLSAARSLLDEVGAMLTAMVRRSS